ncbi:MAG: hypothetical protein JOY90_26210 [Bradyrhizobium sp.]|uniref:hypothetical protein n=1 Tax=Bradyrhizobium sp. TaxID=376 RepID=UPI001D5A4FB8|nr:hypothetical protein [Bradyrhizobium sp.]MBV9563909.1 hypothetical protein [Bradyrhizobium sp.]
MYHAAGSSSRQPRSAAPVVVQQAGRLDIERSGATTPPNAERTVPEIYDSFIVLRSFTIRFTFGGIHLPVESGITLLLRRET